MLETTEFLLEWFAPSLVLSAICMPFPIQGCIIVHNHSFTLICFSDFDDFSRYFSQALVPQTSAGRPWRFHSRISTGFPMTCRQFKTLDAPGDFQEGTTQIVRFYDIRVYPRIQWWKNTHNPQDTLRCQYDVMYEYDAPRANRKCHQMESEGSWAPERIVSWVGNLCLAFLPCKTWLANLYKSVWNVAWSSLLADTIHVSAVLSYAS